MARKTARPNLFDVEGGKTSISYATTGLAGKPSFSYRDDEYDVRVEGPTSAPSAPSWARWSPSTSTSSPTGPPPASPSWSRP